MRLDYNTNKPFLIKLFLSRILFLGFARTKRPKTRSLFREPKKRLYN
jgi:hypothetical protein